MQVGEFLVSVAKQDDGFLVSVEHRDQTVFHGPLRGEHGFLPFRFNTEEGEVLGLISANEKSAVLYRGGARLARTSSNPDFRKIASRVFRTDTGPDLWDAYTMVWNGLIGAFSGGALVFGLFSSTDPVLIGTVALVVFLISLAIERSRDNQAVTQLRAALGL